jgi:PST family polysaccharide transporter
LTGLPGGVTGPLGWSFVQQIGRIVPGYVGLVVLTRILDPADFGIVGIAGLWLGLLNAFVGAGFGPSVVASRGLRRAELDGLATTTVLLGFGAALLGVAIAFPLCALLGLSEATPYAQVSSMAFALSGFGIVPFAVAQRQMDFRVLARRDIVAAVFATIAGVTAALLGAGAWALVIQPLVLSGMSSALICWSQRKHVGLGRPRWSIVREHAVFAGEVTAFQLVKAGLQTAYRAVVGALLGATSLGLYMLGYKLAVETTAVLRAGLGGFLFPFFANRQDDNRALTSGYVRATRGLLALTATALSFLVLLAPYLVPFLFGSDWERAVAVTQVLALVALADCVFGTSGELMKAVRHSRGLLLWSICYAIVLVGLLVAGAQTDGMVGAAWGAAAAGLLLTPLSFHQASRRLGVGTAWLVRQVITPVLPPIAITISALAITGTMNGPHSVGVLTIALVSLVLFGLRERHLLRDTYKPAEAP